MTPTEFTVDNAMTLSAVYRAISVISTAAAQLGLTLWMGNQRQAELPPLIRQPDPNQTRRVFIRQTVTSMATSGEFFWRKYRRQNGQVNGLEVLNPFNMIRLSDDAVAGTGRRWEYASATGRTKRFRDDEIHHGKLLEIPGGYRGLGPLQAYRAGIVGALDTRDYSTNFFTKGDMPNGVLSTDQQLNATEADEYRKRWRASIAGHGVAVLGKGLAYERVLLSPADVQFLETQQFQVTDIARIFGIPATFLLAEVNGNSMTYTNMVEMNTAFVRFTLMGYLNEIEDALSTMIPRGQEVRFDLDGLLRADEKTRFETYKTGIDAGFLTTEWVQEKEGIQP